VIAVVVVFGNIVVVRVPDSIIVSMGGATLDSDVVVVVDASGALGFGFGSPESGVCSGPVKLVVGVVDVVVVVEVGFRFRSSDIADVSAPAPVTCVI